MERPPSSQGKASTLGMPPIKVQQMKIPYHANSSKDSTKDSTKESEQKKSHLHTGLASLEC